MLVRGSGVRCAVVGAAAVAVEVASLAIKSIASVRFNE